MAETLVAVERIMLLIATDMSSSEGHAFDMITTLEIGTGWIEVF